MGHQYLPLAGGLCRILNQPLCELLKRIFVRSVIQHRNINITALHRVPGGGDPEYRFCRNGIIAAVVCLMVANHMDHVCVTDAFQRKQLQGIVPLIIITDVVHCVTQLNAKMILSIQQFRNPSHACQGILLLNISNEEEAGFIFSHGNCKAPDIGPDATVTDPIIVGCSGCQSGQRHIVHAVDLLAGSVGNQPACAFHLDCIAHVGCCGNLRHSFSGTEAGIAHPGDVLFLRRLSHVVNDVIGCAGFVAYCIIAVKQDQVGAVTVFIFSPQLDTTLCCCQSGNVDQAVFIGGTQYLIVGIHADTDSRNTVFRIDNACQGFSTHYSGIRLNAIGCFNGIVGYRRCKASCILVQIANIQILCLLATIRALRHLHVQATTLSDRCGNAYNNGYQFVLC